jgi:hypothetical protein
MLQRVLWVRTLTLTLPLAILFLLRSRILGVASAAAPRAAIAPLHTPQ